MFKFKHNEIVKIKKSNKIGVVVCIRHSSTDNAPQYLVQTSSSGLSQSFDQSDLKKRYNLLMRLIKKLK